MDTSLVNNKINIEHLEKYAAIIGENPSKGARSPKLWNAVFETENINFKMIPLDVSKDNIIDLLNNLNEDKNFIGGAVAIPYKEDVANWLDENISIEAKKIGAVNCLYRDYQGKLKGTNTDGEASIVTFQRKFGSIKNKFIMLLGIGGAGKAVASYFASNAKEVVIISRSVKGIKYANKINAKWDLWDNLNKYLNYVDVVVNCTSLGYGKQENLSPLDIQQIKSLKKTSIIFDIVYQPLDTKLLKIASSEGFDIINGLDMNLEQAVLAYKYTVNTNINKNEIRNIMSKQ